MLQVDKPVHVLGVPMELKDEATGGLHISYVYICSCTEMKDSIDLLSGQDSRHYTLAGMHFLYHVINVQFFKCMLLCTRLAELPLGEKGFLLQTLKSRLLFLCRFDITWQTLFPCSSC